ncbi:hypothetical protein A2716_02565 [candidate division WWE3 bacterium RIFCSPHIGHO2_01_FULL_40_23]|uniref:Uncharacterized protein n=1 Tax=candidate division WWE3 bacterium RIFCSPLOWO2_01_FULL_41_18 TaxID=1802625 RepID=A0A1F4VG03_UNCKA|nr:MAG: hypothetical protein A2716_02565 [candidate division WWE3 bacterium RIFCSPHIGHO2_01_FULL_40_23]OGC55868.1 MAG: hypothetical protein A3A78_02415 [candidate division WWE3 bacterium RIFCSPLOWO2_01_FULL_41_18]
MFKKLTAVLAGVTVFAVTMAAGTGFLAKVLGLPLKMFVAKAVIATTLLGMGAYSAEIRFFATVWAVLFVAATLLSAGVVYLAWGAQNEPDYHIL